MEAVVPPSTFEKALAAIDTGVCEPDPDAPSLLHYRLRPSEEAAILLLRQANPPPPWGIKINLARTFIGPEKCLTLSRRMILNSTVTFLDLSMCDLQEDAAVEFFTHMKKSKSLKHLSVNGNYIGDAGAIAAAPLVTSLQTFHCSSNDISEAGALAFAAALIQSSTIKTLALRNNRITNVGFYALLDALIPPPPPPTPESPSPDPDEAPASPEELASGVTSPDEKVAEQIVSADAAEEIPVPVFNETLYTLWIDQNIDVTEDDLARLAIVLAKRFPKPPESKSKKKKGNKSAKTTN